MTAIAGRLELDGVAGAPGSHEGRDLAGAMLVRMAPSAAQAARIASVTGGWLGRAGEPTSANRGARRRVVVVAEARIDGIDEDFAKKQEASREQGETLDETAIRHAYLEWGETCAEHLDGDFAFALWDEERAVLLLARSVLGTRTLYVHQAAATLRFASEAWALLADPAVDRRPNLEALALFLAHDYTDNGPTLLDGVTALAPGETWIVSRDGTRVRREDLTRDLPRDLRLGDEEYAAALEAALTRAVRARTRRAARVAIKLSGGLDSSSVACLAAREAERDGRPPPLALHLRFPGLDCDETRESRAVTQKWRLPSLEIEAAELAADIDPRRAAEPGMPPYYPGSYAFDGLVSRAAAQHGGLTVLGGEGGDLCLGPTPFDHADALLRGELGRLARRFLHRPVGLASWRSAFDATARQLVPPSWRAALRAATGPRRPDLLLAPSWQARVEERRLDRDRAWARRHFPDHATRWLARSLEESGQQVAVGRIAAFGRRSGVTLEHPFLDRAVVRLLLSLPPEQRHLAGLRKPKPALRRAVRDALPPEVHRRTTAAEYGSFVRAHVFDRHRDFFAELLGSSMLVELGLVRASACRDLLEVERTGALDLAARYRMLSWFAVELWLRQPRA